MNESSCCSIFLSAFDVFGVLDFSHSNRCVSHCSFNFQFPNDIQHWVSFYMLICHFPGGSDGKVSAYIVRETWVQSLHWEDPLEKEMATHSSILAWKIPWMEERGGLQSVGSQRVGHD